jgi:hypothetical protein
MMKTVAIVGRAKETRDLAPFDDLSKLGTNMSVEADFACKCFGSNVSAAIRSIAARRPQEVYCPPGLSGFRRSPLVRMQPKHTFVRLGRFVDDITCS